MMKTLSINCCIMLGILLLGGCNSKPSGTGEQAAPEFSETHPKGQASVVDDVSAKNILQIAAGSEAHKTLTAAVAAASIEHVLVNAGPLTVFAPTDAAFERLPAGTLDNLLKPENKSNLALILTRHAAPGSYDLETLKKEASKGRKLYMATGDYLDIVIRGDTVTVAGARIVGTIQASNGIINVVDAVILK